MKVTLTAQEIIAKFGLPEDIELVIETERKIDPSEWISNVDRDRGWHPEALNSDTMVEVKFRNGETEVGNAEYWGCEWKETDGNRYDIVAYRILKD